MTGQHLAFTSTQVPVRLRSRGLRRRSVRNDVVRQAAVAMLDALGMDNAELSILLCDDETIRRLNRRYRKKDSPTDVLAFPMQESPGPVVDSGLLGDVVISVPAATRQAAERDRPIIEEVTFLLAHGLLHLLGYDHDDEQQEREMTARTEALVAEARKAK